MQILTRKIKRLSFEMPLTKSTHRHHGAAYIVLGKLDSEAVGCVKTSFISLASVLYNRTSMSQ